MAEELGDVVTERAGEGGDWTGLATVVVVGADVVDTKTLLTPVVTLWLIDWNKLDSKFSSLIRILNTIEMNLNGLFYNLTHWALITELISDINV